MADNARDGNGSEKPRTDEADLSARLRRLGDRLGRQRPGEPSETHRDQPAADASGFTRGLRLSSELVAGVLIGAAIGWALDRVLGISPWGLIVFLLLGFAAGVANVVRAAGAGPGAPPESKRDDTT